MTHVHFTVCGGVVGIVAVVFITQRAAYHWKLLRWKADQKHALHALVPKIVLAVGLYVSSLAVGHATTHLVYPRVTALFAKPVAA